MREISKGSEAEEACTIVVEFYRLLQKHKLSYEYQGKIGPESKILGCKVGTYYTLVVQYGDGTELFRINSLSKVELYQVALNELKQHIRVHKTVLGMLDEILEFVKSPTSLFSQRGLLIDRLEQARALAKELEG